jgi:hypothetical protein
VSDAAMRFGAMRDWYSTSSATQLPMPASAPWSSKTALMGDFCKTVCLVFKYPYRHPFAGNNKIRDIITISVHPFSIGYHTCSG